MLWLLSYKLLFSFGSSFGVIIIKVKRWYYVGEPWYVGTEQRKWGLLFSVYVGMNCFCEILNRNLYKIGQLDRVRWIRESSPDHGHWQLRNTAVILAGKNPAYPSVVPMGWAFQEYIYRVTKKRSAWQSSTRKLMTILGLRSQDLLLSPSPPNADKSTHNSFGVARLLAGVGVHNNISIRVSNSDPLSVSSPLMKAVHFDNSTYYFIIFVSVEFLHELSNC